MRFKLGVFVALCVASIVMSGWTDVFSQEASKDKQPVPLSDPSPPKLIAVWPAEGDQDVEPNNELRLKFDQPIDPKSFNLQWKQGSYLSCGEIRYQNDRHEMIIPIRLQPGVTHEIEINPKRGSFQQWGFVSTSGQMVATRSWTFSTEPRVVPKASTALKVVSIQPPLESTVRPVELIRVQFDQPMDPNTFELFPVRGIDAYRAGISFSDAIQYDEDKNEFTFPVIMPPDAESATFEIRGLQSQQGQASKPLKFVYSTKSGGFSDALQTRLNKKESIEKLKKLMTQIDESREKLTTVSLEVHTVAMGGRGSRGYGYSQLSSTNSSFKMQGTNQFYANISQIMRSPFEIGSDGKNCWFLTHRRGKDGVTTPTLFSGEYEGIHEKYLRFLKPFPSVNNQLEANIRNDHYEYVGKETLGDSECHVIRSWRARRIDSNKRILMFVHEWWIDMKTLRPIQFVSFGKGYRHVSTYEYHSINQKLAISEFQPKVKQGIVTKDFESLGDGYKSRFIKISDGTDGRISCRWGKFGAKGTSSSGLN